MIKTSFFHQSIKGNTNSSSYIITICCVLLAIGFLGSIPLLIDLKMHGHSADLNSTSSLIETLGKSRFLIHILFPFVLTFFFLWGGIKFLHKRPFLSLFTASSKFRWKRSFSAFTIWGAVMLIMLFLSVFNSDEIVLNFDIDKFIPLFFISVLLIPIQTTTEELLFRGYFAQGIHPFIKKGALTIIITSICFALMHAFNPEVQKLGNTLLIYYFLTGIFLGIITLMDNGLELAIGYHAANNFFTAILISNDWQAFQTDAVFMDYSEPSFTWDAFATLLIIQPLMLLLFSKMYKWKKWKETLF
ncbi:MAG: CPBP family intramembrane metalloprotease [Crocinitomicaceae bacterium]|nr:CPBP family intramembrane metalloprotease [Crocinitomicaceae bacterium]